MPTVRSLPNQSQRPVRRQLLDAIECLLAAMRANCEIEEYFQDIVRLLEATPMASADYRSAISRVRNTRRYLNSLESGAAAYELLTLAAKLRSAEPPV